MPNEHDPKTAPAPPGSGSGTGAGKKPGSGPGPSKGGPTPKDNDKPPQTNKNVLAPAAGGQVRGAVSAAIGTSLR
jgi:hypothetical protein